MKMNNIFSEIGMSFGIGVLLEQIFFNNDVFNEIFCQVWVDDVDQGLNSVVFYMIVSGNVKDVFIIDEKMGEIKVFRDLD